MKLIAESGKRYDFALDGSVTKSGIYLLKSGCETFAGKIQVGKPKYEDDLLGVRNEINVLREINSDGGHPNVIEILDHGEIDSEDGGFFYVMPKHGHPLRKWISYSSEPDQDGLKLLTMYKISDALEFVNSRGRIHMDVTPKNMLFKKPTDVSRIFKEDCDTVLIDFGLSHKIGQVIESDKYCLYGTPAYISPEQINGEPHEKSDVYGFGATLFHMISGNTLFHDKNAVDILFSVVREKPPLLSAVREYVPEAVDKLVKSCLINNPDDRPRIDEVKTELRKILENSYDISPDM